MLNIESINGSKINENIPKGIDCIYEVQPDDLLDTIKKLIDDTSCYLNFLSDIFVLGSTLSSRLQVCYSLLSLRTKKRVLILVDINKNTCVPSLKEFWLSAWYLEQKIEKSKGVNFC